MLAYMLFAIAGAPPTGAPLPAVRVSVSAAGDRIARIRTIDLDLATARDRDILRSRVAVAAAGLCAEADPNFMWRLAARRCRARLVRAGHARSATLSATPQRRVASLDLVAPRSDSSNHTQGFHREEIR